MKCRGIIKSGPKNGKKCRRKIKKHKHGLCGYHQKTKTSISNQNIIVINDTPPTRNTFEVSSDCACAICLENNSPSESINLGCKHRFHLNCIVQIDGNCCPMCRSKITGVPSYIATILKKNYDSNKKIKSMQIRLNMSSSESIEHSSRSEVIHGMYAILSQMENNLETNRRIVSRTINISSRTRNVNRNRRRRRNLNNI
uniref:Putative RING finger E3 ubiquitin ligase n=1 Tax=Pithovirus LCPAC001 TaxID=2506585 RepID=A0A481Z2J7_9VIRU|nr:MAG: putative RING finger E3 ubiquitin ligase [Pithovirus LCPAC001]